MEDKQYLKFARGCGWVGLFLIILGIAIHTEASTLLCSIVGLGLLMAWATTETELNP